MGAAGRFSIKEKEYIKGHVSKNTPSEIAAALNKSERGVRKWIKEHMGEQYLFKKDERFVRDTAAQKRAGAKSLTERPEWVLLQGEFGAEELEYFKYRYGSLVAQFKEDIPATEEMQLFMLIKMELLISRVLAAKHQNEQDMGRQKKLLGELYDEMESLEGRDRENKRKEIVMLETQLASLKAAESGRTSDFVKLEEKQQALMKDLKATREQRMKNIENNKETFTDLLKQMEDEEFRNQEGRELELVKMSTAQENLRLIQQHQYADGVLDQPILCAETLPEDK